MMQLHESSVNPGQTSINRAFIARSAGCDRDRTRFGPKQGVTMKVTRFRQPALSALAVLLISGAGIAFAGNAAAPKAAVAAPVVAAPVVAAPAAIPAALPTTEPVEPAGADTDTLEQGDQTTPDAAGAVTDPAEAAGTETEKAGAEETGDANLPGGGHADDPNDANADHQFEGV